MVIGSFCLFILFTLLPVTQILNIFGSFIPAFQDKVLTYMEMERESNWAPTISHFVVIFAGLAFLLNFYSKVPDKLFSIILIILLPLVLSLPFGFIVYDRFIIIYKPLLFIAIIICGYQYLGKERLLFEILSKALALGGGLYILYSIYLYRANIQTYFSLDNLFLFKGYLYLLIIKLTRIADKKLT